MQVPRSILNSPQECCVKIYRAHTPLSDIKEFWSSGLLLKSRLFWRYKQCPPILLQSPQQTKVRFHQSVPWGNNEFIRLTYRAMWERFQDRAWVTLKQPCWKNWCLLCGHVNGGLSDNLTPHISSSHPPTDPRPRANRVELHTAGWEGGWILRWGVSHYPPHPFCPKGNIDSQQTQLWQLLVSSSKT